MGGPIVTSGLRQPAAASDDRREWLRIDDRLLLEYRLAAEAPDEPLSAGLRATPDAISAAIAKPTADLLARNGEALQDSLLVPWLKKIDWLLELTLKTLAATQPQGVAMAQVTEVNLSGGGVSFAAKRQLEVGQDLAVKLILPPFTPIATIARVIRVKPSRLSEGWLDVATQFTSITPDDQESLIRHILSTQAERLRAQRAGLMR